MALSKRIIGGLALGAALAVTLTGCAGGLKPIASTGTPVADPPTSSAPATDETQTATPKAPASTDAKGTDYAKPGSTFTIGEAQNVQYQNTNDAMAVLSVKVKDIGVASDVQYQAVLKEVPEIKGQQLYLAHIDLKKVAGAAVAYDDATTDFQAITKSGLKTQVINLIGYDFCPSTSFPKSFDTSGETISTCIAASAPKGGNVPEGVMFAQYGSQYDSYSGKPVAWFTK